MVEPLAVAWHAVKAGRLPKGGKALVIGEDPGLMREINRPARPNSI
jgi:hypothetical protein